MILPEDLVREFPCYQGTPIAPTATHWLLLLALVGLAFALLIAPIA